MNLDFHYYGTYCAAMEAGYAKEEAKKIAYFAQFVDECTATLLKKTASKREKIFMFRRYSQVMSWLLLEAIQKLLQKAKLEQ